MSPPQYEDGARDPHDIDTLWLGGGVPQVTMNNLTITVVNNRATVRGEVVDVNGTRIQEMKGTFTIQCRNNTHYGSWAGTFEYAF